MVNRLKNPSANDNYCENTSTSAPNRERPENACETITSCLNFPVHFLNKNAICYWCSVHVKHVFVENNFGNVRILGTEKTRESPEEA